MSLAYPHDGCLGKRQRGYCRLGAQTGVNELVAEEASTIITETAARIFADLADPQTINRVGNGAWKEPLWQTLGDAGLLLAWVPEKLGGSGASLAEGFAILGMAGRFALAVPLAETLAAGWLLARAGLEAPAAPMTLAPARPDERITIGAGGTLSGRASAFRLRRTARILPCLLTTANAS